MRRGICGVVLAGMLTGCGLPSPVTEAPTTGLLFRLQGVGTTITFQLPVSPKPDGIANACAFNENSFCERDIPVSVNGEVQNMMTTFYGNGGMSLAQGVTVPMVDLIGADLFSGSIWSPTFKPGIYTLITGDPRVTSETYTLTVSTTSDGGL